MCRVLEMNVLNFLFKMNVLIGEFDRLPCSFVDGSATCAGPQRQRMQPAAAHEARQLAMDHSALIP
jgi:hypothetical protein